MCRLFSWASLQEITPLSVLGIDEKLLADLSTLHKDGWGAAVNIGGVVTGQQDTHPAFESDDYKRFLIDTKATSGIIHLRWATEKYAVCIENTHPFLGSSMAFEHNGGFGNPDALLPRIDSEILAERKGTVDSELYFLYLRTLLKSKNIYDAYAEIVPFMESHTSYSSLNAMILSSSILYVVAVHNDDRRPEDVDSDYYHLQYQVVDGIFSSWSTGIRSADGIRIPNNHILSVDLNNLNVHIQPINIKA
jgi:predicted glutamine amidotransferase